MAHAEPTAPYELPTSVPDFFSREECRGLMDVIDAASLQQAEVWIGDDFGVHPESRRGAIAMLSTESEIFVQDRVRGVVPDLERRFGCEIPTSAAWRRSSTGPATTSPPYPLREQSRGRSADVPAGQPCAERQRREDHGCARGGQQGQQ